MKSAFPKIGAIVVGLVFSFLFAVNVAHAVTWTISEPDVSPASDGHTNSGPVSYIITYTEEVPPLQLLDDPGFFSVVDENDDPVDAVILLRAIQGEPSREIRIESIQGEGEYRLLVQAETAEDGNGFAIAGEGNSFTVDKTLPEGTFTGPFEADLTTDISQVEVGQDIYYLLDLSVDELTEPDKSLKETDVFFIAPLENVWQDVHEDYFEFTDMEITGDVDVRRNGGQIEFRVQNINGPEIDFGIKVLSGAFTDFANNFSDQYQSDLVPLNDELGPEITIDAPSPQLSNGIPVIFHVNYENASNVTLTESDVSVQSSGGLTYDLNINQISNALAIVEFSNFVGDGTISFNLAAGTAVDASGDLADAAGPSDQAQIDTLGPQVVFNDPSPLYTTTGPASIGFNFVGAVSVSLVESDIIVNTTGTASFEDMYLMSTGPDSRQVEFLGLAGEGSISINIPAAVAIDQYLQESVASDESPAIQVGPIPPMSIGISEPSVSHTVTGPVTYQVSYAGVASISLSYTDVTLQTSGTATANTISVSGSGLNRTITLDDISGEGAIAISVAAGTAQDAEANPISGIVGNPFGVGSNDADGDLVPDGQEEFVDGSDKNNPSDYLDSDKDIVPDFVEVFLESTNPDDGGDFLDSDGGGTPDYVEQYRMMLTTFSTNELDESDDQQDTDSDGLPDYLELLLRLAGQAYDENSNAAPVVDGNLDSDTDGINDGLEFYLSELLAKDDPGFYDDFDRDGYFDHHEVLMGLDPRFAALDNDADQDGIANRVEAAAGGDIGPGNDLDADGIPDYIEYVFDRTRVAVGDSAAIYISNLIDGNPLIDASSDTDADGMNDLDELELGFNPLSDDTPVIWLRTSQGDASVPVCHVSTQEGQVELRAMLGNWQTNVSNIDWSNSAAEILGAALIDNERLWFDPSTLTPGQYTVQIDIERVQNAVALSSSFSQVINIHSEAGIREDRDEDGICDDLETEVASVATRNQAPQNSSGTDFILTDYANYFHLASLSVFADEPQTMQASYSLIESAGAALAPAETDIVDSNFGNLMPRLHFEVRNINEAGGSATIWFSYVSEQAGGLPVGSEYRLLIPTGWQTFDETVDSIESAPQDCDAAPVFQAGLQAGNICIRMRITDGGANDLDALKNGVVTHLGAPALAGADPVDEPEEPGPGDVDPDDGTDDEDDAFEDFVPGSQKIFVGEAGSFGFIQLVLLLLVSLVSRLSLRNLRVSHGSMQHSRIFFYSSKKPRLLASILLAFLLLPVSAIAEEDAENEKDNIVISTFQKIPFPPAEKLYLGLGFGLSGLDAEFSNLYEVKDDSDTGIKLWLDYQVRKQWFVEFEYANLGKNSVQASEAAIATNVFPAQFSESMAYQHVSVTGLYNYPLPYRTLSAFAKGGFAYADISSDLDIEVADRLSPSIGLGLQYVFREKFIGRLEYETFSKDSNLFSLGMAMRLGDPKPEEVIEEEPEPVAAPEPEPEEVVEAEPEPEPEKAATLDELLAQQELNVQEEPSVDMEAMFQDLKQSLEPSSIFEKGSATLSRRLMGNLDEIIYFLDSFPSVNLVITGHASDEGHEYLNENLSHLRAHGAKTYLQAQGIDDERVVVRARGEHFPAYDANDEDFRIRNRRIEYDFYIPKDK